MNLKIHNNALLMATHPKVLGLTLDPKLTYNTHIHTISVHTHKPLPIIKTLTATGWGKEKETLMATYKAVMRPALEYASSIWWLLCLTTPLPLFVGGVRSSYFWSTSQLSPSGQQLHHSSGVCPQIQG